MSAAMMMPAGLREAPHTFGFCDDFGWFISPHLWTTTGDANNTATITANAEGGVVALTTTATDNDQVMIATTNAFFKFAANCDIEYVARVQYSEAATDDANVAVGLSSSFTTDVLRDNGLGAPTNHSGALILKVDGGTKWLCHSSVGTTQTTTTSVKTAGGSDYVTLKIKMRDQGDGNVRVDFFADDEPLRDSNGRAISHSVAHSGALSMKAGVAAKAGDTNAETVSIDYVGCYARRP